MPAPLGIVASSAQGNAAWTPAQLTNLALWLDASNLSSLPATSPVAQWSDLSSFARHYTAAGALQPTREAAGAPGGKPCVRFDGTQMMTRSSFNPSTTNWMIASVVRTDSGQPSTVRGYYFLGNNTHVGVSQFSEGTMWYASVYGGIGWTNFVPAKLDAWDLQLAYRDASFHGMRSKGVQQGGTTAGVPNAASGASTVGSDGFGTKTKCRISEIVVVAGSWNTTERDKLESYLMTKWGL